VRDDKGKPKALVQLAESCKAIVEGRIPTVMKPARIYPVCVSDEPAVESFFFTPYSNEVFQKEVAAGFGIQPVTVMSVNELEEIMPYVSAGSFSWEELLDFRLNHLSGAFSVRSTICCGKSGCRRSGIRRSARVSTTPGALSTAATSRPWLLRTHLAVMEDPVPPDESPVRPRTRRTEEF